MLAETTVIGIDFGSKLAGTTVLAYGHKGKISLQRSIKGKDADRMILDFAESHDLKMVGIDAPLSLPAVYSNQPDHKDYFYRQCDRELKAMSPMFLGGLTARAMRLKDTLNEMDIEVFEVYPVQTARLFGLEAYGYRSKNANYVGMLSALESRGCVLNDGEQVNTNHDIDALLALDAVSRIIGGKAISIGEPSEGLIHY